MKKLSASCILAVGIAASSAAFAQIPVTDGASIAKSVENQIETMAKWKMQYDQMVSQIDQMKQQYAAVTGARGMGELFNNPQLRDYLQPDPRPESHCGTARPHRGRAGHDSERADQATDVPDGRGSRRPPTATTTEGDQRKDC